MIVFQDMMQLPTFYGQFTLPDTETEKETDRARSHLATMTQIFDVVTMSSDIGCVVINVTVRTCMMTEKSTMLSPSLNGPIKLGCTELCGVHTAQTDTNTDFHWVMC